MPSLAGAMRAFFPRANRADSQAERRSAPDERKYAMTQLRLVLQEMQVLPEIAEVMVFEYTFPVSLHDLGHELRDCRFADRPNDRVVDEVRSRILALGELIDARPPSALEPAAVDPDIATELNWLKSAVDISMSTVQSQAGVGAIDVARAIDLLDAIAKEAGRAVARIPHVAASLPADLNAYAKRLAWREDSDLVDAQEIHIVREAIAGLKQSLVWLESGVVTNANRQDCVRGWEEVASSCRAAMKVVGSWRACDSSSQELVTDLRLLARVAKSSAQTMRAALLA